MVLLATHGDLTICHKLSLAGTERAVHVDLPLAVDPFLQNRQLEMLNGNLVYLLLPLAKALLLV